jgi:hypothetical protein
MIGLGPLELVPRWLFAAVVLVLAASHAHTSFKHNATLVELAELRAELADERAARAEAVAAHERERADLIAQHNAETTKADHDHKTKLAAAEDSARRDADTVRRLRNQIAGFASPGAAPAEATSPPAVGGSSPSEVLGNLLSESLDLLVEGRKLHEIRDAEVMLLLDQIDADRAMCERRLRSASNLPPTLRLGTAPSP